MGDSRGGPATSEEVMHFSYWYIRAKRVLQRLLLDLGSQLETTFIGDYTDHRGGVNQRVTELSTTFDLETSMIYAMIEKKRDDRLYKEPESTVGTQQEEIIELCAADHKLQAQFIKALNALKSCQTQLTIALGRIQILEAARVPAQLEVSKEAGSSS
uniref:Uncharacterized protein n=1 Tax=Tanacetum cinerariifolium TaxID=118510 RepID=A0A699JHS7_TANCI|nr:hypothetical protein [Tanacetum cinerariifolium]